MGLVVLGWVIFVNLFPDGYVFGGGDTNQLILAKDNLGKVVFQWGWPVLFYSIFYFLSLIGISDTLQLSFYLGIFLFGSYFSFFLFSKLLFKNSTDLKRSLVSLFYSLNLYTLFLFTGNTGFSHFPSFYVFIPLLVGLFINFFKSNNFYFGVWFCVVLLFSSMGFGNPAFALSFSIFVLFLVVFLGLSRFIKFDLILLKKIFIIGAFSLLVSAFWILPVLSRAKSGVEGLATSNVIDFDSSIRSTSSPLSYTLSLRHFSDMYFPQNFYYKNFDWAKILFVVLSFVPIVIIGLGAFQFKKLEKEKRNIFLAFLALFVLFVMLVARVRPPFEISNYYIFHIWGFIVLRGYDKTAIYIPFLMASFILILMTINKKWIYAGVFLALLAPLPFYVGKLQQTAGYRVNSEKDYAKAKMSFLVKIPEEYYETRNVFNIEITKSKIATLPSTFSDGSGIVYYPKWNFYGGDITQYLYPNSFVEANNSVFSNWSYADDFSGQGESEKNDWIVKLLGLMNAKYIIYHKDAPEEAVQKTIGKMKNLEERELIKNLEENDYFILYEISPDYFLPYLSWQTENFELQKNSDSVQRNFAKIKAGSSEVKFQEINPKKFVIDLSGQKLGENLILAETFNPLWKAYAVSKLGKETEIQNHFVARGYANGWKLENKDNIAKIVIEYYPIRLMWRGAWISGITVLFLIAYLLKYYYVKRKLAKI